MGGATEIAMGWRLPGTLVVIAIIAASARGAHAQSAADRERAQIRQLQQQVQKLQQDNAALRRERDQAAAKARDAESAARELAGARAGAGAARREATVLRGELGALRGELEQMRAELARAQQEVRQRDEALQQAAHGAVAAQRRFEADSAVLGARLKQNTGRAELCEARHAQVFATGEQLLALYERDRLRLCEPVTGLWRVREETRIQDLRERLLDARLELPATAPLPEATRQAR
jgi:chromosome segregation ATPase